MRGERGQASVEWIGLVLLVALALAAVTRFAPRADGHGLATTLVHGLAPTASRAVVGIRSGKRNDSPPPGGEAFAIPPLVPRAGEAREPRDARGPGAARGSGAVRRPFRLRLPGLVRLPGPVRLRFPVPVRLRVPEPRPLGARGLVGRLRSGAGLAWRRAWLGCLAYERARYGFLHAESGFPGHRIPPSEMLRMANDCISPVDLVRDWPLLRGR